jgi:hypothetical protein
VAKAGSGVMAGWGRDPACIPTIGAYTGMELGHLSPGQLRIFDVHVMFLMNRDGMDMWK